MSSWVKVTLWVVGGLVALSSVCCVGSLVFGAFALPDEAQAVITPGAGPRATTTARRAGFKVEWPADFKPLNRTTWRREQQDGSELLWLEVHALPRASGDDIDASLAALWQQHVVPAFPDAKAPLVQRRFVNNGARAHWARARVHPPNEREPQLVSLYLIEADDHLEAFMLVQGCTTQSIGAEMIIEYSFPKTHQFVEAWLTGVNGSPVGAPLLDDEELIGRLVLGDTSTLQWVNVSTGSSTMTVAARSVELTLGEDHTFSAHYAGASGQVGALKFGSERETGTWKVEHDVLVLETPARTSKHFLVGATRGPEGQRVVLMQAEPTWSLSPHTSVDVYVVKD